MRGKMGVYETRTSLDEFHVLYNYSSNEKYIDLYRFVNSKLITREKQKPEDIQLVRSFNKEDKKVIVNYALNNNRPEVIRFFSIKKIFNVLFNSKIRKTYMRFKKARISHLIFSSLITLFTLVSISSLAFAQDASPAAAPTASAASSAAAPMPSLDSDGGLTAAAKWVWGNVVEGHWWPMAAGMLVIVVWLLRKYGGKYITWFTTDKGGACLALGTSMVGAVLNALMAGQAITVKAVMTAVGVGFAAAGGWTTLKRILAKDPAAPATPAAEPTPPTA